MTKTQTFDHVADDTIRTYLLSDESTSLDVAGSMIDLAAKALDDDEKNEMLDYSAIAARDNAIAGAQIALGYRDSVGVRRALRDFWNA